MFDVGKWELDLVASRVVVDVVGDARFVRRVEDDQIHRILTHSSPAANAERTAGEVMNDC